MKEIIKIVLPHVLPITLGIGSIFLKYYNIDGWAWFFGGSIFLAMLTPTHKNV